MLQALVRTITELLDSKKAAYSVAATVGACVLHLYFGVSVQEAILLVSPLGVATLSQAHVDASVAKSGKAATVIAAAAAATPSADPTAAPSDGGAAVSPAAASSDATAAKIDD